MDLYEIMRTTFAVREFTDAPLPDPTLFKLLENARFAPSGGNRQGWYVIIVRDRTTREALAALTAPAAQRYVAQQQAGESPWNSVNPTHVEETTTLNFSQFVEAQNVRKSGGKSLPQPQRILLSY